MAPVPPLGREAAMKLVAEGRIPIAFGTPHPFMAIVEQEGMFRIRALVVDPTATPRITTPEAVAASAKPTGRVFAEAATREGLLAIMKTMEWPRDW